MEKIVLLNRCAYSLRPHPSFEHNREMHLWIDAEWFPKDKEMVNVTNTETDDQHRVTSRLNTIKSTKTWSKGRRYSLHGTQSFMEALGDGAA